MVFIVSIQGLSVGGSIYMLDHYFYFSDKVQNPEIPVISYLANSTLQTSLLCLLVVISGAD
jgi:hypothetical protein